LGQTGYNLMSNLAVLMMFCKQWTKCYSCDQWLCL